MTTATAPGLRERKRRQTRRAILLAALTIAQERGPDAVTVDEVARIADVSPRTFFNYFASKDEAILGERPTLPAGDIVVDAFVAGEGALMPELAAVAATAAARVVDDHEIVLRRRELMQRYPELNARRQADFHLFEEELAGLVAQRLVHQHPDLAADPAALRSRAQLVGLVAISVMRHAWTAWLDAGRDGGSVLDHLDESVAELEELFGRAAV